MIAQSASPEVAARPLRIWLPTVRAGSGSDVFVQRLAAGLERAGHQPIIQWFDHRFELMPWRLRRVVPPPHTDIIHCNTWQGFAFKRAGIPLVLTEHHYVRHPAFARYRSLAQAAYHRFFIGECLRRSYRAADAVVAVSRSTAEAIALRTGRSVPVIHNWVDTDAFRPAGGDFASIDAERRFRLLFVGNPSRWKGSDLLPELARRLGAAFRISALGGLRKPAPGGSLTPGMIALPRVSPSEMPALYRQADAVLVLSRYEAFGYVALEAMACGVPVVGFDTTGTAEVCRNGETALLTPVDDLDALLESCRRLQADAELRVRLGSRARERAEALFSETDRVAQYLDCYASLIARNQ